MAEVVTVGGDDADFVTVAIDPDRGLGAGVDRGALRRGRAIEPQAAGRRWHWRDVHTAIRERDVECRAEHAVVLGHHDEPAGVRCGCNADDRENKQDPSHEW